MKISKKLIQLYMADQKLTVKLLAEKSGMKPQNLSNILTKGHCKPATAGRIADALGVDVQKIIKED